ncbi:hypothetical protein L6R53_28525, partial [Myxococcota bacterium]|nr:hypothetical protein [Myxococcota bacterium]
MDIGLIVSFAGVIVAALAGILGVWMERDPGSPKTWGFIFSGFIVVASGVELSNTVSGEAEAAATDATLATVLEAMSELASKGNNPALEQFVGAELAVQARANPQVVKKMEKNIAAKGGDPKAVTRKAAEGRRMAAGLPASKPAAGARPTLGGARAPGAAKAAKAGRAGAAARGPGGAAGARSPGGLAGGPGGAAAGAAGAAMKAGKAGAAAASAVE